jgi:hypothetical protein
MYKTKPCAILKMVFNNQPDGSSVSNVAVWASLFCMKCPEFDEIPDECPEVCALHNSAETEDGGCELAPFCPCMTDDAHDWVEKCIKSAK